MIGSSFPNSLTVPVYMWSSQQTGSTLPTVAVRVVIWPVFISSVAVVWLAGEAEQKYEMVTLYLCGGWRVSQKSALYPHHLVLVS